MEEVPDLRETEEKYAKKGTGTSGDRAVSYTHLDVYKRQIQRRRDNEAVKIDESMEDLFGKVMNQNFVPVVDDKRVFIGIVTRKDILAYLGKKAAAQENGVRGMDQA